MQIRDLIEQLQQCDPTEEIVVEIVADERNPKWYKYHEIEGEIDRVKNHPGRRCKILEVF